MSYEIVSKEFSTTSYLTLATNIAAYIVEQVPELTLARTYTSGSTVKIPFLQWDGTKAGIGIYGYLNSASYPVNNTFNSLRMFVAGNITSSTGKQIYEGASASSYSATYMSIGCSVNKYVENGTYYAKTTVEIAKLSNGYLISVGNVGMYIGYYTSPIYGKCIVAFNLNGSYLSDNGYKGFAVIGNNYNYSYNSFVNNYYNFLCIFSEDGSTFYNGQGVTFSPDVDFVDDNAVLSPIYFVVKDVWIEPILIPDIYFMKAKRYPAVYEEATVGEITVHRMTNYGNIVVV